MAEVYNTCFYPNTCHVCKQFGKDVTLKRCGRCFSISYCGKLHQVQHWPDHKQFCKVMRDALKQYNLPNMDKDLTDSEWSLLRENVMIAVSAKMELEYYEKEMIWFMRACAICHRQNDLEYCQKCTTISYCVKHKNDTVHNCKMLKLCFDLDINCDNLSKINLDRLSDISNDNIFDMRDFINTYVTPWNNTNVSPDMWAAIYSEQFSRSLTVFYMMKKLGYLLERENLVIHVAASNFTERYTLRVWEVLFHLVPRLTSIHIVLVGSKLQEFENVPERSLKFCNVCVSKQKKISCEMHGVSYEVYIRSTAFTQPDLFVKFNPDFEDDKLRPLWFKSETVELLFHVNFPYLLVFPSNESDEEVFYALMDEFKDQLEISHYGPNPFASLRPHRINPLDISYENSHVIICKNIYI